MAGGVITFWPVALNRNSAPEGADPNSARLLENVDVVDGRIKRRLGLAALNVDASSYSVSSCFYMLRPDGLGILFDGSANGTLRLTLNPAAAWSDVEEFVRGTQAFNENFNE